MLRILPASFVCSDIAFSARLEVDRLRRLKTLTVTMLLTDFDWIRVVEQSLSGGLPRVSRASASEMMSARTKPHCAGSAVSHVTEQPTLAAIPDL